MVVSLTQHQVQRRHMILFVNHLNNWQHQQTFSSNSSSLYNLLVYGIVQREREQERERMREREREGSTNRSNIHQECPHLKGKSCCNNRSIGIVSVLQKALNESEVSINQQFDLQYSIIIVTSILLYTYPSCRATHVLELCVFIYIYIYIYIYTYIYSIYRTPIYIYIYIYNRSFVRNRAF